MYVKKYSPLVIFQQEVALYPSPAKILFLPREAHLNDTNCKNKHNDTEHSSLVSAFNTGYTELGKIYKKYMPLLKVVFFSFFFFLFSFFLFLFCFWNLLCLLKHGKIPKDPYIIF
jgi:sensor histidine kinase YesM